MEARSGPGIAEKLQKLSAIISELQEAEEELRYRENISVDKYFLSKIDEWANKIAAVSSGYYNEFNLMYKHRVQKMRTLVKGHGDVTIGDKDDFSAQTIQSKVTTGDHSAVNNMLKNAFNQLTGERGEKPRPNDRLVISMVIDNPNNTWPGGANTLGTLGYEAFKTKAIEQLKSLALDYRPHAPKRPGHGLSAASIKTLTDVSGHQIYPISQFPYMGHPGSSQYITHVHGQHPSQGEKAIHLTVKIYYTHGFPVLTGHTFSGNGATKNTYNFIHKVTFNGFRMGKTLHFIFEKMVIFNGDGYFKI